jgi:S1-C subfamily serine protease
LVTKVDRQLIDNADALSALVLTKAPGTSISVNYRDPLGAARTTRVLLGTDQGQQS